MLKQLMSVAGEELSYDFAYCQHLIGSRKRSRKKVLVNGSPKTGTTWMLKMMTSLPGYEHAPGYNFRGDLKRYAEVQPGQVVHGHDRYTSELREILQANGIKAILMVRDPRDQAVSRMFHVRRETTHPWYHKIQEMNDDEALLACIEGRPGLPGADSMLKLTYSWLEADGAAQCIRYEDVIADPVGKFKDVLQYLDISINDNLIQSIVERNRFERLSMGKQIWKAARQPGQQDSKSHYRKGIIGDWKNHFKAVHRQKFKAVAGEALIELGYEQGLDW